MITNLILENKQTLKGVFAVCMIVAGITHFIAPHTYVKIVPPQLPYPEAIVYISGFFEILGGIGLLIPLVSQAAAWGLVLLLIAVYPANINMAVNNIHLDNVPDGNWFQAIRLPFQFVLIAWAYWYTRSDAKSDVYD
ncbi:DoxX family protein [Pleurocapsa sp. FMAR1]|uniref:DoxX family protein n=1 Tax=Pleurocapsa sp. FMAR1 TaxID=3040204 RepID=UPI0029C895F8|nr:DoxX family protein [Pleurocapsa sp. FMAR1]